MSLFLLGFVSGLLVGFIRWGIELRARQALEDLTRGLDRYAAPEDH